MSSREILIDFELLTESSEREPEYRLLSAVVLRAICDLSCTAKQEIRRDARYWFTSDKTDPFSYNWICQHLDIPPQRIRHMLNLVGVFAVNHSIALSPDNLIEAFSTRLLSKQNGSIAFYTYVPDTPISATEFMSEFDELLKLSKN